MHPNYWQITIICICMYVCKRTYVRICTYVRIPAVKPAVQLLQIQEVHPVAHSSACNFAVFYLFFLPVLSRPSFTYIRFYIYFCRFLSIFLTCLSRPSSTYVRLYVCMYAYGKPNGSKIRPKESLRHSLISYVNNRKCAAFKDKDVGLKLETYVFLVT